MKWNETNHEVLLFEITKQKVSTLNFLNQIFAESHISEVAFNYFLFPCQKIIFFSLTCLFFHHETYFFYQAAKNLIVAAIERQNYFNSHPPTKKLFSDLKESWERQTQTRSYTRWQTKKHFIWWKHFQSFFEEFFWRCLLKELWFCLP